MYLLPGNPLSQAVEAYRDSGEALCSKGMQAVPRPFRYERVTTTRYDLFGRPCGRVKPTAGSMPRR